jgi:uncharacterized protein YqhQ
VRGNELHYRIGGLLLLIWIVIGIFVARDHHYFSHVNTFARVISAILGVILWPLVLGGANLHIHF